MRIGMKVKTGALVCLLSVVTYGCSRETVANRSASVPSPGSTSGVTPTAASEGADVPSSLSDAGEFAENVYDQAAANDWKAATISVKALGEAARKVRLDVKHRNDVKDALDGHTLALDGAVAAHNRWVAMRDANQVTLAVAELTGGYRSNKVPVELMRLDYYGRELEIWGEVQDTTRLHATVAQMVREWDSLRPAIDARSATQARRVGDLLAQSEGAATSSDYAQLSKSVLAEVDQLETLFN